MIDRRAAAQHSAEAAAKHISKSACKSAGHLPCHSAEKAAAIHLSHHLPHLLVLTQKLVDLGYRRTRTTCDTRLSARIDDAVVVLFRTRHRTDDRLRAFHLMIDHRGLLVAHLEAAGHLIRQHLHQFRHRTELLELPELLLKILQRELVLGHFQKLRLRFLLVDLALDFLDQRQNVAHAEDPLRDSFGIERLDRDVLFADADEYHWLADYLTYL